MTIDKNITVDLNRVQPHKIVKIHEGDVNSVYLVLTVTKDGQAVSLSGLTIKYDATIAGFLAEQDASGTVSGNTIRVPITKNMTALPGALKIDVRMVSGTQVLYTQTVTMIVEKSVIDDSTTIDIDGTTIGGRLNELEAGMLDVKTVVQQLNAKFPLDADDIKDNEVIKVKAISNTDTVVNEAVQNHIAYAVSLDGRTNMMFCVNSGSNLRTQYRFDTLGYVKYRTQVKNSSTGEWNTWSDWTPIASYINIPDGAIGGAKLADKTISNAKIEDGAIGSNQLASNSILARHLTSGCVETDAIDNNAVTSVELADGAVTTAKLASNAVTGAKIANSAVGASHLATGAVTEPKLHANAVTTTKIANGAVTSDKIANEAIYAEHLTDCCVETSAIDIGAVTTAELANGAVSESILADNAVTNSKIANSAVTNLKLADGAVTTVKISDGNVTEAKIKNNAVTTAKLADSSVTTAKIAAGAITAAKLDSGVLSGYMKLAHTTTSEDSGQFFLERVGLSLNAVNLYLALYSADPKRVAWYSDIPDISGKADAATTLAGYGITNAYTKDEIDSVYMELAPDTNPSSISVLQDGQLFRCQGGVAIKNGNASDYIELAKKSIVPTAVSQLTNDSGYLTAHQDISGKANIENGGIPSNHAWYTEASQGYTMTGNYTIIGDTCFLHASAKCISGWERVFYSLPVACTASSATIALSGSNTFTIATGVIDNISVLEIKQMGTSSMSGDTIIFTLIYKCQ